jgi:hypothetical protein
MAWLIESTLSIGSESIHMRFHSLLISSLMLLLLFIPAPANAQIYTQSSVQASVEVLPFTANVMITGFSVSASQITRGSQISFTVSLQNTGLLTSGNIVVHLSTSGPSPSGFSKELGPLVGLQSEELLITMSNSTSAVGTYTATVSGNYVNDTGVPQQLNTRTLTYSVVQPILNGTVIGGVGVASQNTLVATIPNLYITFIPLFVTIPNGTSLLSNIGLRNTGNAFETVNLTTPKYVSSIFSISRHSTLIAPGQSTSINLLFNATGNAVLGTYVVPLNIALTINSNTINQTEYMMVTIIQRNTSQPSLINQINIINNTQVASGILEIKSPSNSGMNNVLIQTVLPPGIVSNISQITAFGISSNITLVNRSFVINWHIGSVPRGGSAYGYYTISNPTQQALLGYIQNLVVIPSSLVPNQILRVIDSKIPSAYVNTPVTINVRVLYTGSVNQTVLFDLVGNNETTIYNSTRGVKAVPNEIISQNFTLSMNTSGTFQLALFISTAGANIEYPIVLLVLPKEAVAPSILSLSAIIQFLKSYGVYIAIAVILIMLILIFLRIRKSKRSSGKGRSKTKG